MNLGALVNSIDSRAVITEAHTVFNVPVTAGQYAPERLILNAPEGFSWYIGRFLREAAVPAGAVCEEWQLKVGGNPINDGLQGRPDDYLPTFSLMTANLISVAFGPRTYCQARFRSGGTAGTVTVNALATNLEPIIEAKTQTFNISAVASELAPESIVFSAMQGIALGHVAAVMEQVSPSGTTWTTESLKRGGDPANNAHWLPTGVNWAVGAAVAGNPSAQYTRMMRLRARSGGTSGAVTVHAWHSARTGVPL